MSDDATKVYLEIAMSEHLAMRDEMSEILRHNFNLVLAALTVAAGTAVTAAANTLGWTDDQRAFLLLVAAGFGFIICLGSIGLLNSFKVVEWYVERTGADIARVAKELRPDARVATLQPAIRRFTTYDRRAPRRAVALLVTYGAAPLVGLIVIALLAAVAVGGYVLGSQSQGELAAWTLPLFIGDVALAALSGAALFVTYDLQNRWDEVLSSGEGPTAGTG